MSDQERIAFGVEIHNMTAIVFAETAAKARWIAVKHYWDAYGKDGYWPCPVSWRIPKYDNNPLKDQGRKCWTEDHVRYMQP